MITDIVLKINIPLLNAFKYFKAESECIYTYHIGMMSFIDFTKAVKLCVEISLIDGKISRNSSNSTEGGFGTS